MTAEQRTLPAVAAHVEVFAPGALFDGWTKRFLKVRRGHLLVYTATLTECVAKHKLAHVEKLAMAPRHAEFHELQLAIAPPHGPRTTHRLRCPTEAAQAALYAALRQHVAAAHARVAAKTAPPPPRGRRRGLSRTLSLTDLGKAFTATDAAKATSPTTSPPKSPASVAAPEPARAAPSGAAALEAELERRLNERMGAVAAQRVAALEARVAQLERENSTLRDERDAGAARAGERTAHAVSMRAERDALEERVRLLNAGGTSVASESDVTALQAQLTAACAGREAAEEQLALTEASLRAASEQLVGLNRELAALQAVVAGKKSEPTSEGKGSLEQRLAAKAEACLALKSHVSFLSSQMARANDEQRRRTAVRQETARRLRAQRDLARFALTTLQASVPRASLASLESIDVDSALRQTGDHDAATREQVDDLRSELTLLRREHFYALVLSIKLALSTKRSISVNVTPDALFKKLEKDDPDLPVSRWPAWIDKVLKRLIASAELARK